MQDHRENGTDEEAADVGIGLFGDTGGSKTRQVSVWLREDQIEDLEQFQNEYDLSRSEAVRIAVDMMGSRPDTLELLSEQREEMLAQMERLDELEAQLGDVEDLDKAVAHINKAHPDMPVEIKDIRTLVRELREGEDPPDWFTKYL